MEVRPPDNKDTIDTDLCSPWSTPKTSDLWLSQHTVHRSNRHVFLFCIYTRTLTPRPPVPLPWWGLWNASQVQGLSWFQLVEYKLAWLFPLLFKHSLSPNPCYLNPLFCFHTSLSPRVLIPWPPSHFSPHKFPFFTACVHTPNQPTRCVKPLSISTFLFAWIYTDSSNFILLISFIWVKKNNIKYIKITFKTQRVKFSIVLLRLSQSIEIQPQCVFVPRF